MPLLLLMLLSVLGRSGLFIIIVKRITINNERMGPSVSNRRDLKHLRDFCLLLWVWDIDLGTMGSFDLPVQC